MSFITSIAINGAMISAVYALIAIGFTLILGIRGVINLTHGALIMVGAYAFLVSNYVLPPLGAFVVGITTASVASFLVYKGVVQYVEGNDLVVSFMTTLVLALFLQQIATMLFSSSARSLAPLVPGGVAVGGTRVSYNNLIAFVISIAALTLVGYFINRTRTGRSILATSMTEKGAVLTGVNIDRVNAVTWLLAGGLAGLAGVFWGSLQVTSPTMWFDPLNLAFIIVIIGGIGSIRGSLVGAVTIGYLQTITVTVFNPSYRGLFSLLLLAVVILIRPEGLFGREYVE
ncbi:branched-chain amino acid ABC transporter permease [Halarchaeum acidiphilum]|uniref:branched-chain amino acid ABC transporter permease n=1 Tax=Halarchaeum acidiphilum TaxID=489138 RepID=UPI0003829DAA|nr:branched-chain amino acid ABC transporter permease [Halarchaeum acidiphilum]